MNLKKDNERKGIDLKGGERLRNGVYVIGKQKEQKRRVTREGISLRRKWGWG